MDVIVLRQGNGSELEAMYQLDLLCFSAPFRFSRAAMARAMRATGASTVVAALGSEIVGFLIVEVGTSTEGTGAYLATINVHPGLRRHGLGRRLMTEAERIAAEQGAVALWLHVWTRNEAAIQLYERLGYEARGTAPAYYGAGFNALVYRRQLDQAR